MYISHLASCLAVADHDCGGERHAPLPGGPEGGADELVDGVLLIGVGHDDAVVLGPHVALHALTVRRTAVVNVLAGRIAALKNEHAVISVL